jgi:adenosylcobinamide-GDP ribazoletransferase
LPAPASLEKLNDDSIVGNAVVKRRRIAEFGEQIRLAVSFLTIIPVISCSASGEKAVAESFGWFPLVGFGIGAALCVEDFALGYVFSTAIRSVLIVMSLAIVTGALHLDGLADTADALGAGRDRARALEILHDPRIGSFGAIALFFALGLKVLALARLAGATRYAGIYLAPGLARYTMVMVAHRLEYVRAEGAGTALLVSSDDDYQRRSWNELVACATVVIAVLPAISIKALCACAVAVVATLLLRAFYQRWIGGVTGDLIGAAGEIVETAVLITFASLLSQKSG